jgi:AAA15 family ATPase/GTPase
MGYDRFHIENYRCFDSLDLDNLKRVNLIAGKNNVGKTALLESIFIHSGSFRPTLALSVDTFRGMNYHSVEIGRGENPWHYLFNNLDLDKEIKFVGKDENNGNREVRLRSISDAEELENFSEILDLEAEGMKERTLSETDEILRLDYEDSETERGYNLHISSDGVEINPKPPKPKIYSIFLDAEGGIDPETNARRFGNLKKEGKEKIILDILKQIEPRLKDVNTLPAGDKSILHGDIGLEKQIPLAAMGGGLNHLASIVLAIADASGGIVLIDEVENGIHYSVLEELWEAIDRSSRRFNTQVFATTHSLECIESAHSHFEEEEDYDFKLTRLERTDGKMKPIDYKREELDAALESGLEVR